MKSISISESDSICYSGLVNQT